MIHELPQKYLDILYTSLDEEFHDYVCNLYVKGQEEKQEYKEYYFAQIWKELNHETSGKA